MWPRDSSGGLPLQVLKNHESLPYLLITRLPNAPSTPYSRLSASTSTIVRVDGVGELAGPNLLSGTICEVVECDPQRLRALVIHAHHFSLSPPQYCVVCGGRTGVRNPLTSAEASPLYASANALNTIGKNRSGTGTLCILSTTSMHFPRS
jgi:hypothetical protein